MMFDDANVKVDNVNKFFAARRKINKAVEDLFQDFVAVFGLEAELTSWSDTLDDEIELELFSPRLEYFEQYRVPVSFLFIKGDERDKALQELKVTMDKEKAYIKARKEEIQRLKGEARLEARANLLKKGK